MAALLRLRQVLPQLYRQQGLDLLGDHSGDHNAQDEFQQCFGDWHCVACELPGHAVDLEDGLP